MSSANVKPKGTAAASRQHGFLVFKPPPPVGDGGGYMFSGRPSMPLSVRPCVRASVRDSRGSFMFPRCLQYLLTDFRQTFVTGAPRDRDELVRFWGQKVKVQGHTIAAEAHSTRRYRRVFVASSATFSIFFELTLEHRDRTEIDCRIAKTGNKTETNIVSFKISFLCTTLVKLDTMSAGCLNKYSRRRSFPPRAGCAQSEMPINIAHRNTLRWTHQLDIKATPPPLCSAAAAAESIVFIGYQVIVQLVKMMCIHSR